MRLPRTSQSMGPLVATGLDTTPPTPDIIAGPTRSRISRVAGRDSFDLTWQASENFQHYKIKVVPATNSPHTAGTLIEEDVDPTSGGTGATSYNATITDDELVAADPGEGSKIVKVFVQDIAGNWST